jgi:hypothetical protein
MEYDPRAMIGVPIRDPEPSQIPVQDCKPSMSVTGSQMAVWPMQRSDNYELPLFDYLTV